MKNQFRVLSNFFTKNLFDEIVQDKRQGNEKCLFKIMEKKESEEKTRERVRAMLK
jgi:hypothetical protein